MEKLFPHFLSSSRIWIFQSNKKIIPSEISSIHENLKHFLPIWKSHGHLINASYEILHGYFLIVAANNIDGYDVSGCGIDELVHRIKSIGVAIGIDFFMNSNVAVLTYEGIKIVSFPEIKQKVETGEILPHDKVFVNTITTLEDLDKKWIIPVQQSWMSRFFNFNTSVELKI